MEADNSPPRVASIVGFEIGFEIGQQVTHCPTGTVGRVVGIWIDRQHRIQVESEYVTDVHEVRTLWAPAQEFTT